MSEILTLPPPGTTTEADADRVGPLVLLSAPDAIDRLLALARSHLGMEVALVSEFTHGRRVVRNLEGNQEAFGLRVGDAAPLSDTYCWRVVHGDLPRVIPDAKSDVRLRDLEMTWADIGSYIGVPIRFSGGRTYGSLCCLSHDANPSLRGQDAEYLTMLAGLIGDEVEAEWAARRKRLEAIDRIRTVLEGGGLGVAFQPILDLGSLAIAGFEALTRFQAGGSPEGWFAEAAEIGLGLDLERAAKQMVLAHLETLPRGAYLWVNLSPEAAGSTTFCDMLVGAPTDRIIVGLTPTEPAGGAGWLVEAAQHFRARGLRLAIDDLGGEVWALKDILRLQPDVIRLDAAVVGALTSDPSSRDLASFLVRFGSELGAVMAARGIETPETLSVLRDLGVAYGQGYALAPPLTLEDLAHAGA